MSNSYDMKQFQTDLEQLGGMIENFYNQPKVGGGKRGGANGNNNKPKNLSLKVNNGKAKSKPVRAKKAKSAKSNGTKHVRRFVIHEVDGKPYPHGDRRYSGAEPKDAARKAFRFACKKLGKDHSCKIKFTIREATQGSSKKIYGAYNGRFEKLNKPRQIIIKQANGKIKNIKPQTHKIVIDLAK